MRNGHCTHMSLLAAASSNRTFNMHLVQFQ